MPAFCTNCGAEAGNGRYCLRCGNPLGSAATPSASQPTASKPGAGLKIALIALALIAIAGIASVVGIYYYATSRVHARLAELKQQTGIDLAAMAQEANRGNPPSGIERNGCLLLTKTEAERILGFALVRADGTLRRSGQEEHCDYYAAPQALQEARKDAAARFRALVNSKPSPQSGVSQAEDFVKSLSAGANDGSTPVLEISVYRGDANSALAGFHIGNNLIGAKTGSVSEPWDEAIFGPMNSTLAMRKGANGVLIDLRQIPNGHDTGLAIARLIAPRL